MPRNVRNFWIEAEVDGRKSGASFGPASKDGGFNLTIKMRDGGEIINALDVIGTADNGTITLTIRPSGLAMLNGGAIVGDLVIKTSR